MPLPARRLRLIGVIFSLLLLVLLLGFAWFWHRVQRSLPPLDGQLTLAGLSAPATLQRDALGAVSIRADNQLDAVRALGFAHAQDRFFQMDLLRRRGAGELAALFGADAVPIDRSARVHGFRARARDVLALASPAERALLDAYTAGVNAGLASLRQRPWEYLVLRVTPVAWRPEDTLLINYAMAFDLQDSTGRYEQNLTTVRDHLGSAALAFFNPLVGPHDAAFDHSSAPLPPPPGPRIINLRTAPPAPTAQLTPAPPIEALTAASNSLGVTGPRAAAGGAALLAGDPHLGLAMPNVFYRATLAWTTADGRPVRTTGVTIPGSPGIVIGSNGHLAWTFTNSNADTGDLVPIDLNQVAPEFFYTRGTEMVEFETRVDTIEVKGGDPVTVETRWTVWGPIVAQDRRGKPLAHRWVMHEPAAGNPLPFFQLANLTSIDDALALAHRSGLPAQNFLVAHRDGSLAWTICGHLPERFGFDGRLPVPWTFGDRGWHGLLPPERVPVVRAEPGTGLSTANQRLLGGDALALLGDGGYDSPDRGRQLQQGLDALPAPARPADLLAIQLDDRARWIEPWRELLLATLTDAAVADHPARAEFRRLLQDWSGRAAVDSVAYRLLRTWHGNLVRLTLNPIFAECFRADPAFSYSRFNYGPAVYSLHRDGPPHLLAPHHADWAALRLAAVDATVDALARDDVALDRATWGAFNTLRMQHPFSRGLPAFLADRLTPPSTPLPGDSRLPRVQRPAYGATLRLAVAPGREEEGILHLPGGQSGHFLSPFYLAGHEAWARGEPTPLLPGPAQHTLTLTP